MMDAELLNPMHFSAHKALDLSYHPPCTGFDFVGTPPLESGSLVDSVKVGIRHEPFDQIGPGVNG